MFSATEQSWSGPPRSQRDPNDPFSVKHLECWYYFNRGDCKWGDGCRYSHVPTGNPANKPVPRDGGPGSVAGKNAQSANPTFTQWQGIRSPSLLRSETSVPSHQPMNIPSSGTMQNLHNPSVPNNCSSLPPNLQPVHILDPYRAQLNAGFEYRKQQQSFSQDSLLQLQYDDSIILNTPNRGPVSSETGHGFLPPVAPVQHHDFQQQASAYDPQSSVSTSDTNMASLTSSPNFTAIGTPQHLSSLNGRTRKAEKQVQELLALVANARQVLEDGNKVFLDQGAFAMEIVKTIDNGLVVDRRLVSKANKAVNEFAKAAEAHRSMIRRLTHAQEMQGGDGIRIGGKDSEMRVDC